MAKDESKVVAVRPAVNNLDELERVLRGGDFNVEVVEDPAEISKQMVAEILDATSVDDLESSGEAEGWAEYEGIPMEIHGFNWRPSTIEGGGGIYFVVFTTSLNDGENHVLTTGSLNVCAKLTVLARLGEIPGAVRILVRSEKPTKAGFYPLNLEMTPEETERRKAERVAARSSAA